MSANRGMVTKKMWYVLYTMEYYSAIERKERVLFTETWMDLESVILSQVSQSEKDKYDTTYMWNLKKKKKGINELIYTTEGEPQL